MIGTGCRMGGCGNCRKANRRRWRVDPDLFGSVRRIEQRTGEMHVALATDSCRSGDFVPEPFTGLYQRSMYQSAQSEMLYAIAGVAAAAAVSLAGGAAQTAAEHVLTRVSEILELFRGIHSSNPFAAGGFAATATITSAKVLYTGKDFVIIDFEGEPAAAMATARRIKRTGLPERGEHGAALLRSVTPPINACYVEQQGLVSSEAKIAWQHAADFWYAWSSSAFLRAYASAVKDKEILPKDQAHCGLCFIFRCWNAVYELSYELNNRPERVETPLRGILELLETRPTG